MPARQPRLVWHGIGAVAAALVAVGFFCLVFGTGMAGLITPFAVASSLIAASTTYIRGTNDPVPLLTLSVATGVASMVALSVFLFAIGREGAAFGVLVLFFGTLLTVPAAVFAGAGFMLVAFDVRR